MFQYWQLFHPNICTLFYSAVFSKFLPCVRLRIRQQRCLNGIKIPLLHLSRSILPVEAPLFNSCLASDTNRQQGLWCGSDVVLSIPGHKRMPRPLIFPAWSHARHWLRSRVTVSRASVRVGSLEGSHRPAWHDLWCAWKKWLLDSSLHSSAGCEERREQERERERCVIMKSSAMNQWGRGDAHVLGGPLIGDHVFVADRLWNGVLLHGCGAPASHQGDWLVWSCGMFPSGLQ